MGSASSKFKKYIQHGDEFAAMQIYQSSPELRKNLDPNLSYGENHQHNTALHYAAKHGMKHLLRTFLNDHGGNPNKKNGCNENVLHAACQVGPHKTFSSHERRAACVTLLLQWRGVTLNTGEREKVEIDAQDSSGNSPLHVAASAGLQRCVELLLAAGSPLFLENNDKLTPCDMAMRAEHHNIARMLESRMVFADDSGSDTVNEVELYGSNGSGDEVYSGLRTQDLQEAKDQLLVETSDMLNIPLFTAEALLRDNEWSRESLLEKWMRDPVKCCQTAGVQPPSSAYQSNNGIGIGVGNSNVSSGENTPPYYQYSDANTTNTAISSNQQQYPSSEAQPVLGGGQPHFYANQNRGVHHSRASAGRHHHQAQQHETTTDNMFVELSTTVRDHHHFSSHQIGVGDGKKLPVVASSHDGVENPQTSGNNERNDETVCDICLVTISGGGSGWECLPSAVSMSCNHQFCTACWERYLTVKIQEGDAHHILCPAHHCHILVPPELIERLVTPEVARRYLQFDIKAFVETNRSIKWCPMAGCGRAVRLPETEQNRPSEMRTSHAVDCGNGHFFCWECLGEAHAPSGCDQWQRWMAKISEIKPEELQASSTEYEDAANCLWLVTNSKPCPNCKSPIQKNEGCNHMKCSKCKYDFCWVCLETWKRHSSTTGGYFRCNRFEAVHRADEKQGVLISEAMLKNQQMTELNRFLHYYTRFRNHENSRRLEEPLLNGIHQKMEILASSLTKKGEVDTGCTKFVEEGVRELLKARRILCGSYVYGYYLEDNGYSRTIFEFMQNELEEVTEKLSEMVARPYLRTPRSVIVQTTALARRKRHEFARAVSKGLVPPETPPALRKIRKRNYRVLAINSNDGDMSHAIAASLKDLDPDDAWVKDSQGKHNNLTAIYDFPDFDSDEEESEVNRALAVSLLGECAKIGCTRPRAQNPRTSTLHDFCSLRCSKMAANPDSYQVNVTADYNMDLVIALEMSRLQMIEDEMKQRQREEGGERIETNHPATSKVTTEPGHRDSLVSTSGGGAPSNGADDQQQLKLAIQLSLQDQQQQQHTTTTLSSSPLKNPMSERPQMPLPIDVDLEISSSSSNKEEEEEEEGDDDETVSLPPPPAAAPEGVRRSSPKSDDDITVPPEAYSATTLNHSVSVGVGPYHKTSADLAVDYFLKSLAGHNIGRELNDASKTDEPVSVGGRDSGEIEIEEASDAVPSPTMSTSWCDSSSRGGKKSSETLSVSV